MMKTLRLPIQVLLCAPSFTVLWKHNALRHSFISHRVAVIRNLDPAALEAGNSPEMIFEHRREPVSAGAAEKWFGIQPSRRKGKMIQMPLAAVA